MRSQIALTIITLLLLVSLGNAQSDAPPPSRLLRRHQVETPPPSRPMGKVTGNASSPIVPVKVAPFPKQVLVPPASFPVVKPKVIAAPAPLKAPEQSKLVAPAFPKSVAPAFPKKIERVELSKPLFSHEIGEPKLAVQPTVVPSPVPTVAAPTFPKKIETIKLSMPLFSAEIGEQKLTVASPPQKPTNQPTVAPSPVPAVTAPAFPKNTESVELSEPLFSSEVGESKWVASPPERDSTIPLGQRGTWVSVIRSRSAAGEEIISVTEFDDEEEPVKEEVIASPPIPVEPPVPIETATLPPPLELLTLPPLPQTAQVETISNDDDSSPPAMAPPPPIEESVSKVAQHPIESAPDESPFYDDEELPFYDQGVVCENCQELECSDGDFCYDYDEISPVVILGVKGGTDRTITDIRAFLPIWQDDLELLFGDIRGRFDDDEANEGQFGIGYRTLLSPDWIFGVYGYYDLRKTNQRNRFNQFTTGIEFLSEEWDVRLNGYFPNEGGKNSNLASGISNGTIISNAFEERAARGMNVEVGKRILHWGRFDAQEVRWFVGYYRFDNDASGFKRISGPSTRLEFRSYDLPMLGNQSRLTAGVEYTTDDIRDDQTWAFLRVQIPLAPQANRKMLNPLRRRFVDMPVRNID